MLLNCGVGEDSWESLGLQGEPTSQPLRKLVLYIHRKDWCWRWNSSTLATWCEEPTPWKRPWCWERLKEGGEGDDRRWDGWMASLTRWAWVWLGSGVGDGQWSLVCCSRWSHKVLDITEWLNWNDCYHSIAQESMASPFWFSLYKQRHYFADQGPSSQSYGFSSTHVWMWESDYKES